MRVLWLWGLLLLLSVSGAQGLNAERDPRLNQRVSLRVPATPLRQLLRQLEKTTGVELRVENRLGEYRAFVRLQNRPLHETLSLLAETFGFAWRAEPTDKGENAPLRYVLYQPEAEQQREAQERALLNSDLIELAREAIKLIPPDLLERGFEEFCALMGLTLSSDSYYPYAEGFFLPQVRLPEHAEAQGLRAKAIVAARTRILEKAARTPQGMLTLRMLATLNDAEWNALRTEGCLRLSPERLPAAWREQWQRNYIQLNGHTEEEIAEYQPPRDSTVVYPGIDKRPELQAVLKGNYGVACYYAPDIGQFKAEYFASTDDATAMSGWIKLDGAAILQAIAGIGEYSPHATPEWLARTPDKPIERITEKAWTEAIERDWVDSLSFYIVEGLESVGAEGMGEFYPLFSEQVSGDAGWRALLQELLRYYTIEPRGGVWLFQARARALARAQDTPAYRLHALTAAPTPTIDELAALAQQLSLRQITALAQVRSSYLRRYERKRAHLKYFLDAWQETLNWVGESRRQYYALQWYASLNATQRAALKRGQPIPYSAMTPPQRRLFLIAVQSDDFLCLQPTPVDADRAYARFKVEQTVVEAHLALENRTEPMTRVSYRLEFSTDGKGHYIFEFAYLQMKE